MSKSKPADLSHGARPVAAPQVALLFALLIGILLAGCWLVLDPLKYALIEGQNAGRPLRDTALAALGSMLPRIATLGLAGLLAFAALARHEYRHRALSAVLTGKGGWPLALVGGSLLVWFCQAYFYPGHFLAGDTGAHIVRVAHFGRGLADGKNLFWNNHYYMGAPFLQFYAPLFFWLGGGLFALTGDIDVATKLLLLVLHLAGGVFFYHFLRRAGLERFGAWIGAIAYTGAWAHNNLILYKGVLPPAVVIALLPAAFLLAERIIRSARPAFDASWAALAVVCGAMIAAHQPHGVYGGVYLALYAAVRLGVAGRLRSHLFPLVSAGVAGVLIGLFAVVPFMAEKGWVIAQAASEPLFMLRLPTLENLGRLIAWSNAATSKGAESAAYLGLSVIALAVAAVAASAGGAALSRDQRRWGALMLALLALSFVLRGALVRDVIFTLFFVSALAGLGGDALLARRPGAPRLALAVLLAVVVDLGPTAVQPVARTDKQFLDAAALQLAATAPNQRVVLSNSRQTPDAGLRITFDMGPSGSPFNYYPVQTVSGPHNHAATLVHNYAVTSLLAAEQDLRNGAGQLSENSATLLALFNVGRIVNDTGTGMGFPASVAGTTDDGPQLGRSLRIAHPTPVLFAPALAVMPDRSTLERPILWREEIIPPEAHAAAVGQVVRDYLALLAPTLPELRAARIPVYALPAGAPAVAPAAADTSGQPALKILDYQVREDAVDLKVDVPSTGFLQLGHPWYPTLAVTDNGRRVVASRSAIDLIVLPIEPGTHHLHIVTERSALRWQLGAFSLAVLVVTLIIPVVGRLRRGRR